MEPSHEASAGDKRSFQSLQDYSNGYDNHPPPLAPPPQQQALATSPTTTTTTINTPAATDNDASNTNKPKQKRNKPTLSCLECVERKTKCDRSRPCLACVKRQSNCEYTAVANLIASADRTSTSPAAAKARVITKPAASKVRKLAHGAQGLGVGGDGGDAAAVPVTGGASNTTYNPSQTYGGRSSFSTAAGLGGGTSPYLLSNVPYSKSSPSNVFGVGSQHPFSNYWTCAGGLPEVISVMPSREQADILVSQYFECVDPVYPFIHRRTFYADYERFWNMPTEEKNESDAAMLALHYAIYALGTQFVQSSSFKERSQTAEFYASAANQSLRIYSYLNRTSMRAIQAMLLMAYFLMNDNHASDAYAWAGIHLRQSYAMRLHRDPEISVPGASILEKQQRRKLWQAVFFQDTFLTVLLKLPPTATHSDVPVESLSDAAELAPGTGTEDPLCTGAHSRVENLMSISVIAPPPSHPNTTIPPQPHHLVDPKTATNDLAYLRSMWHLGNLVQENLSSPLSLSLPLAKSPRHKETLIAAFRRLHRTFPPALLTTPTPGTSPRHLRQALFATSNYHHCLMLLQASENAAAGVECNVPAALQSASEALQAFFGFWDFFPLEAPVWWVFWFRAFEEGLAVAHLLGFAGEAVRREVLGGRGADVSAGAGAGFGGDGGSGSGSGPGGAGGSGGVAFAKEVAVFHRAYADVRRLLAVLDQGDGGLELHRSRRDVLAQALERAGW
ncbi:hypothetical protein MBLNU230_g5017t1 [Neophaeotheca triangularis]